MSSALKLVGCFHGRPSPQTDQWNSKTRLVRSVNCSHKRCDSMCFGPRPAKGANSCLEIIHLRMNAMLCSKHRRGIRETCLLVGLFEQSHVFNWGRSCSFGCFLLLLLFAFAASPCPFVLSQQLHRCNEDPRNCLNRIVRQVDVAASQRGGHRAQSHSLGLSFWIFSDLGPFLWVIWPIKTKVGLPSNTM